MNRCIVVAIAAALTPACPVASAQVTEEGRTLAAAFSQADLNLLGECQARVEGGAALHAEFGAWLDAQGQKDALAAAVRQKEQAPPLAARLSQNRRRAAQAKGVKLADSEAAYARIKSGFARKTGEDDAAAYTRWHQATILPPGCSDANRRAIWKAEVDNLAEVE